MISCALSMAVVLMLLKRREQHRGNSVAVIRPILWHMCCIFCYHVFAELPLVLLNCSIVTVPMVESVYSKSAQLLFGSFCYSLENISKRSNETDTVVRCMYICIREIEDVTLNSFIFSLDVSVAVFF